MLSKTLKVKDVKTKSGHNKKTVWLLVSILAAVVIIVTAVVLIINGPKTLKVNGHKYNLLVANTTAQLDKGLGGRASLPSNEGMLFVFKSPAIDCFWMKGMHFPLDIIWLDPMKNVVSVVPNIPPSSYPESFCPNTKTKYVIELNAGQAKLSNIQIGESLVF